MIWKQKRKKNSRMSKNILAHDSLSCFWNKGTAYKLLATEQNNGWRILFFIINKLKKYIL